ncbi:c-type cytochrome [Bradyrhizobium sp.]|uniref:c-type cytochrome n=1 Tax=Bradyrhizobium sp. TaxID=376 RepID=UPI003C393F31
MAKTDIDAMVTFLRSVPPITSPDFAVKPEAAPDSHKDGVISSALGKRVFEEACVSCHGWSGESPVTPFATLTGSGAVSDQSAMNVAQIVMAGATRLTPDGALSMPRFGEAYSNEEIAAVANFVTARFGVKGSSLTPQDIAKLR